MEVVMRVPPPNIPQNPTQLLKTKAPVSKTFVSKAQTGLPSKPQLSLGSLPISHGELKELASDLKNGLIDKEEANSRFVKTVINNSIRNSLGEKDREQLIHDIRDFFSSDEDFVQNLAKNLSDLT